MLRFIIALSLVLSQSMVVSQSCGIISDGTDIYTKFTTNTASVDVNTYWHIVRDDNGNGQNSEAMLNALIDKVVLEYSNVGINLTNYCESIDHNINIINSTFLVENSEVFSDTSSFDLCNFDSFCLSDGLNVFLLHGKRTGLALPPGNLCFAKVEAYEDFPVVVHEIGHCFGLLHPFNGRPYWVYKPNGEEWECDDQGGVSGSFQTTTACDGTPFTNYVPFELVDGSNGDTSGDFVQDTPAGIPVWQNCEDYIDCSKDVPCPGLFNDKRRKDPNCDKYNLDWNNYMDYRSNCRNHFTSGQVTRAKAIIETYLQYMMIPQDVVISSDQTLEMDGAFNSIIIDEGVTLTVKNSKFLMEEEATIYLKKDASLILDNTTITSCGNVWKGISANKKANRVELLNSSLIENAEIGVKLSDLPWFDPQNHPLLIMNHSAVRYCDIGVQFGHGKTKSIIENQSAISACNVGIKYSNHSGLIIDNSFFNANLGGRCIESMDGYLHVRDGNIFIGGEVGVSVEGTIPIMGALDIGDAGLGFNGFSAQSGAAIVCNGLESPTGANIINCSIAFTGTTAVILGGSTDFEFENNNIAETQNGVFAFATGDNTNSIKCNTYNNVSNIDNAFAFVNNRTQFLENSFIGSHNINSALLTASVSDEIGASGNPSANCFSGTDIFTGEFLNLGNSNPFIYHYFDDSNSTGCQEPTNTGTYSKEESFNQGDGYCNGDIGVFNLTNPTGGGSGIIPTTYDPDDACLSCVIDSIELYINIVVNEGGDDPRTEGEETPPNQDPNLLQHEMVMEEWINFGIFLSIESDNYTFGEEILEPLKKWRWQKRLFGLQVMFGNLDEANTTLLGLSESSKDQIQFKQLQLINLKRIKGEDVTGAITSTELDLVHQIAIDYEPTNGYARSLYYILTGIRLPYVVPDMRGAIPRNNPKAQELTLFPNPTNDRLTLSLPNGQFSNIEILDQFGKTVNSIKVSDASTIQIDVSSLTNGVYFIVANSTEERLLEKFIKF